MKSKRLILLIATVLMLFLTVPVSAANQQTKVTAQCVLPDVQIDVVVPSGISTYLNPKRLPVKIGSSVETGTIVSDTAYIENKSQVPVDVNVSATGTVKSSSSMSLSSSEFDSASTISKRAFLYFEILATSDPESVSWAGQYDENKHLVITGGTKTKNNMAILAAGDENAAQTSKRYGVFHLAGICSEEPRDEWTEKDGVNVSITFTFKARPASLVIK